MMICCPMTSRGQGYPFEVAAGADAGSFVLADQVKGLDWRTRKAAFKGKATPAALAEVRAKINGLLGL